MGTATAPGCSEADTYAGTSIDPWGDVSLTTSPGAIPNFTAVSVEISTHAAHTACVIVSGASWSHERLAPRPSYMRSDGYASSTRPEASPSSVGGAGSIATVFGVTDATGTSRKAPPC